MKSEQIQNLIESLSSRMAETKPEAEARVEKAKAYCAEHGKNRMARLIKGDLSGIQMFIYNVNRAEDVDGGAAKRLRGRSFYVSAACLAFSTELLANLDLPACCRLSWSGGKFLLMVPERDGLADRVWEWKEGIDYWLWGEVWGDLFLNLAISHPYSVDEVDRKYIAISQDLQNQLELGKLRKFESTLSEEIYVAVGAGAAVYHDRVFENNYVEECHSCNHLPRVGESHLEGQKVNLCMVCNHHEKIGSFPRLPTHPFVVCRTEATQAEEELWKEKGVKFHDTWIVLCDDPIPPDAERVPAFSPELYQPGEEKRKIAELCDVCTLIPSQRIKGKMNCLEDRLATRFHCLAALANEKQDTKGNKKIAVMAGDMDHLSVVMNAVPGVTLKQAVTLGELIYHFFTVDMIKRLKAYQLYLAYSGGDDFVVIGAWDRVVEFAAELSERWEEMLPEGARLTFSAGLQITNPQYPIYEGIYSAQRLLKNAKEEGRNRIDVMGIVMEWERFRKALKEAKWLKDQVRDASVLDGPITIGFLYRMYDIWREYDEKWRKERDPVGLRYISQLTTHIQRNVQDTLGGNEVKAWLQPLLNPSDEKLLPHFRFILDWVVLMKRK